MKLLVGEELFARYDRLLLQSSLDLMADVVYCPRKMCHSAVMTEPNATMGICPSCQFAFCVLCKRAYHGVSECQTTAGTQRPFHRPTICLSICQSMLSQQRATVSREA